MKETRARALPVPLQTDSVAPHRLVTGSLEVAGGSWNPTVASTALFFEKADDHRIGRVTFEGMDSLRVSRGEYNPYDDDHDFSSWVYVVENSPWLAERHDYEWSHYQTLLLATHQHYLFVFHDDFVEVIAEGIWFDAPKGDPLAVGDDHPLVGISSSRREHGLTAGLEWELVRTLRDGADLLRDAEWCSQPLFSFALTLDGQRMPDYTAWLRVRDGVARSSLRGPWVGEVAAQGGTASPADFLGAWENHCAEVADRRRARGLTP